MTKIAIIIISIIILSFIVIKFIDTKKTNPKELELTYKINAGIPFKWEYEIEDENTVEFVKSYILKDENTKKALTGAPVYTNYVFKGLKKGTTTITFKLVNFTDNTVHEERKHIINVDENLNISETTK